MAALLDQLKATESPVIRHLDLMFIQHSIGRLEPAERRDLVSKVLAGIGKENPSTPTLFNVFLRIFRDLRLPPRGTKEDAALREDVGLSEPSDAQFVAEWLGKLLLLRPQLQSRNPGLTEADVAFLTLRKDDTWKPTADGGLSLPETRIKAITFLASGAFTDGERFMPAVFAVASPDSRISGTGDDLLKRSTVSLEEPALIERLFEAHSTLPAAYRIRILNLLSKSAASTGCSDQILAAVRQDMTSISQTAESSAEHASNPLTATGLELTKIHRALFEYINWVARMGPERTDFNQIGGPLVELLRNFVTEQGWPAPARQSFDDITLRARAYETVGVLAKRTSMSVSDRISLIGWLFRSLSEDPTPDVVVNIDGALSSLTSLMQPPHGPSSVSILRSLLLTYMTLPEEGPVMRSARHAATKYANHCLPFSDEIARWIDLIAIAGRRDERSDVVEEGHRGLDPWTYYINDEEFKEVPDWKVMVQTYFQEPISHINTPGYSQASKMDVDGLSVFTNFSGDALQVFPLAVNYCKRIMFLTILKDEFKVEPGWERQLEALVQSDMKSRDRIRGYLKDLKHPALEQLLDASLDGMLREKATIVEACARCFVEIASFTPRGVIGSAARRAKQLLPLVRSNTKEIRALGAKAYGILASHTPLDASDVSSLKKDLSDIASSAQTAIGSELNAVQGAFLALGYLLSTVAYCQPSLLSSNVDDLPGLLPSAEQVSGATPSFQEAIFETWTQLWTAGIIALRGQESVDAVIKTLVTHAKKGNEKAITALGRLAIPLPDEETQDKDTSSKDSITLILDRLYELHELKQAEVHFAVGEAITAAVARWDSEVVQLSLSVDCTYTSFGAGKRSMRLSNALEKILADSKTTKPALLKASGIWLFCLIQHCSHLPEVQSRLRECQVAFMRLLSARDELVQETASRGLALVYEKGDPALKDDLVRDLVSSFTGSGPKLEVDDDTELFDAGALPTGEGKSITSYKDIVNLANEVGDQSLVYKFMSLATNAATWSTRSAFGRFGLSNILSESEIDPKLYPKLYRYRFDPNQNVQRSMNDIWKALVKDSNAVLDTHFDSIMKDLLKSVLGKEWRVREASCAAISDLIQGRPFQRYEQYYQDIWTAALKVLDDVKASVREAALRLCIGMSNTLVRQLEESSTSASSGAMMNEALPFLLSEKGIESGVEDVKIFSTITVMKIAKTGGKALKPFIATMVPHLLGLLSTIEPDAINYHYLRAGEDNREKIDKLRTAMVSQSPISEAIENLLCSVDAKVMVDLGPGIETIMKNAVGMPTKIGCSRVLSTLATRHASDFEPYSARFLRMMEKQTLDRNDEVSKAYARGAAYIIRVAPAEAKERFIEHFTSLYFSSEDEARREKVADIMLALSKISPDHFNALEARLLPFAYLASHDTDEYVQRELEEVWGKHAGSSRTVSRYVPEIVALVERSLDTAQWALKHAGALTVAAMVVAVTGASDATGQVSTSSVRAIWPVLDKSLALKTFPSKEKLLEALPDFVAKGKAFWQADAQLAAQLKKIAVREAKRNNDAYRVHAFRCLWRFTAARDDLDMLDEIMSIVSPYLDELKDEDRMEVDAKDGKEDLVRRTAAAALEAVAKGYSKTAMKTEPAAVLSKILGVVRPYLESQHFAAVRRETWYKCVSELMEDAAASASAGSVSKGVEAVAVGYFGTLDVDRPDVGTEDQRSTRAKAAAKLVKAMNDGAFGQLGTDKEAVAGQMKVTVEKTLAGERSLDVQKLLKDVLAALA